MTKNVPESITKDTSSETKYLGNRLFIYLLFIFEIVVSLVLFFFFFWTHQNGQEIYPSFCFVVWPGFDVCKKYASPFGCFINFLFLPPTIVVSLEFMSDSTLFQLPGEIPSHYLRFVDIVCIPLCFYYFFGAGIRA